MKIGHFTSLALRNEIRNVKKSGMLVKGKGLLINFIESSQNRCAFIIRKKMGNAPKRNKMKRNLREIISKNNIFDSSPIHCLIIAKTEAFEYPFNILENEVNILLQKIHEKIRKENE